MEDTAAITALAGLLHRIGILALRASSETGDAKKSEDWLTRERAFTLEFINKNVPAGWKDQTTELIQEAWSSSREKPGWLALADRLSVGASSQDASIALAQDPTRPGQLLSIFSVVKAEEQLAPEKRYWPLGVLQVDEGNPFPTPPRPEADAHSAYQEIWKQFTSEADRLSHSQSGSDSLSLYLEGLLLILQRYTWSAPSAYAVSRPDISYFDQARITAALAAVLSTTDLAESDQNNLLAMPEQSESVAAILIGGDISGVQDFIYMITAKGATSALRGRSFYLQLLTEAIARFTLRQLKLPITNLIYSGGGNFYILARSTDIGALPEIQRSVSKILYQQHGDDLFVALGAVPIQGKDFFGGLISKRWEALTEILQANKQRRFAELDEELQIIFLPHGHGGNEEAQCQVCGIEDKKTVVVDKSSENPDGIRKCPACISYEELGDSLRRAEFLSLSALPIPPTPALQSHRQSGRWEEVLSNLGFAAQPIRDFSEFKAGNEPGIVFALSEAGLTKIKPDKNLVIGRRFLVNVTPLVTKQDVKEYAGATEPELREGAIKPFDLLQLQSNGIPRLGVLRMDVDNLGKLFSEGLGMQASLAEVAGLSSAISLFFDGWVARLAADQNDRDRIAGLGERIYSIYSGGDDLFFVGSWDAVVDLARQIRVDLEKYASNHPGIHASAGIVLVSGKYPLSQAGLDAGLAEEQAKHLRWQANGGKMRKKDAISFLGQILPWNQFGLQDCEVKNLEDTHALMHLLYDLVQESGAAHTILRRLIALQIQYAETAEDRRKRGEDLNRIGQPQDLWGPWMWRGYYFLKRSKDLPIKELAEQLKEKNFSNLPWIGLAARWAELRLRKANEE